MEKSMQMWHSLPGNPNKHPQRPTQTKKRRCRPEADTTDTDEVEEDFVAVYGATEETSTTTEIVDSMEIAAQPSHTSRVNKLDTKLTTVHKKEMKKENNKEATITTRIARLSAVSRVQCASLPINRTASTLTPPHPIT